MLKLRNIDDDMHDYCVTAAIFVHRSGSDRRSAQLDAAIFAWKAMTEERRHRDRRAACNEMRNRAAWRAILRERRSDRCGGLTIPIHMVAARWLCYRHRHPPGSSANGDRLATPGSVARFGFAGACLPRRAYAYYDRAALSPAPAGSVSSANANARYSAHGLNRPWRSRHHQAARCRWLVMYLTGRRPKARLETGIIINAGWRRARAAHFRLGLSVRRLTERRHPTSMPSGQY